VARGRLAGGAAPALVHRIRECTDFVLGTTAGLSEVRLDWIADDYTRVLSGHVGDLSAPFAPRVGERVSGRFASIFSSVKPAYSRARRQRWPGRGHGRRRSHGRMV